MIRMLRILPILLAGVACFVLGSSVAAEQAGEKQDQQEGMVFKGIHKTQRGVVGQPDTARITDRKTFIDITEQEYRERGYTPAFDQLPVLIIQRNSVPQRHGNQERVEWAKARLRRAHQSRIRCKSRWWARFRFAHPTDRASASSPSAPTRKPQNRIPARRCSPPESSRRCFRRPATPEPPRLPAVLRLRRDRVRA
jgi:hypothetical protein